MSEYWVSHKKYFCKYCETYIADDAPSKAHHENGLRHKGNVERFIRGIYKAGEKRKQDVEEEKREMARIQRAAEAAYQQDVATGVAKPGSSSSNATVASSSAAGAQPKTTAALKPSNAYANYSTAQSLGYVDPDAERANEEAELRRTQGVVGDWQFVEIVAPQVSEEEQLEQEQRGGGDATVRTGEKRPAEAPPVDEEDSREWKLRRKTASVGLGDLYDPSFMPIKLKPKKEEKTAANDVGAGPSLGGSELPRWSARSWSKPSTSSATAVKDEVEAGYADGVGVGVMAEDILERSVNEAVPQGPPEVKSEEVKPQPMVPEVLPSAGSLFKKRKAPVGGGSRGGGRRI